MKIKYIIFSYFIIVLYSTSFSQINFGIGVGQQYRGLPGVRVGYNLKAFEPSINLGILKNGYNNVVNMGVGMSMYYHNVNTNNSPFHQKISYNFDFGRFNKNEYFSIHSLVANIEMYSFKITPLQWRLGLGANYYRGKFSFAACFGLFVELEDLKSKGFHFRWANKIGKN
jgi:hypothetical protein